MIYYDDISHKLYNYGCLMISVGEKNAQFFMIILIIHLDQVGTPKKSTENPQIFAEIPKKKLDHPRHKPNPAWQGITSVESLAGDGAKTTTPGPWDGVRIGTKSEKPPFW